MRIAIDARMMGPENTRGIGRYLEELIRAMVEISSADEFTLITRNERCAVSGPNVKHVVADIPWYGIAEQVQMPKIFASINADVVHIPHWNVPLMFSGSLVVTIHDLLLRHEPSSAKASTRNVMTRWLKRIGFRWSLNHSVAAAKEILVPTQFVADDLATFYPQAASKTTVTGEGMPDLALDSRLRKNEKPFLLYVGSAYPHKGLADALDAWKVLEKKYPDLSFVIAGEMDVFMKRVQQRVFTEKMSRVSFLGRVSDEQLVSLYRGATAFVYPTHFEGFGLPPLEALAYGCPVVSSDAGPLKDVLGEDGVIFFRAGDSGGMIDAVSRVVDDPIGAQQYAASSAQTLSQRHDWKTAARRTLEAYARVVQQRRHGIQTGQDIGRATPASR